MIKKTKKIQDTKNLLGPLPKIDLPVPEYLYIAVTNGRCPKGDVFVQVGDHVNLYQVIGMRHGPFFEQPIHATCSGTFEGLEKHYHRSGKLVDFIKIHNDFQDTPDEAAKERTPEEIKALSKDEMTKIIENCANVGLGGSSFPTHVKFQTKEEIKTILINGIECEPYINADHRLMLEEAEPLLEGIKLIQQAFQCKDARICVKKKYKDLLDYLGKEVAKDPDSGITVTPVGNFYPQGWELAMIKSATGIDVPPGTLPSKFGIINFNVSTVVGIYDAIRYNRPVIERNVTVNGDGIVKPANFRVRVGTPFQTLIDACGGYKDPEKPKTFIIGGPMMGGAVESDDVMVSKCVTSILVFNEEEVQEEPCIRCGSCILSCPTGLRPVEIMNAMKAMPVDKAKVKALNPLKCIECGLCTYSCTSKIKVTDYIRRAKVVAKLP